MFNKITEKPAKDRPNVLLMGLLNEHVDQLLPKYKKAYDIKLNIYKRCYVWRAQYYIEEDYLGFIIGINYSNCFFSNIFAIFSF